MEYELIKKDETKGCLMEDGADTRKYFVSYVLVSDKEQDEFGEYVANVSGYQDYSYQVTFTSIGKFDEEELKEIKQLIEKKLGV